MALEVVDNDPFMFFVNRYAPPQFQLVDSTCQPGMFLEDGVWINPPVGCPYTARNHYRIIGRLALLDIGLLANALKRLSTLYRNLIKQKHKLNGNIPMPFNVIILCEPHCYCVRFVIR